MGKGVPNMDFPGESQAKAGSMAPPVMKTDGFRLPPEKD